MNYNINWFSDYLVLVSPFLFWLKARNGEIKA